MIWKPTGMANIPPFEDEIRHARFPLPIPLPEGEGGNESLREFHVHVTVAAVIERDGKFLLVEEETSQGVRFNQPAGHLEADESLLTAVAREVLEEFLRLGRQVTEGGTTVGMLLAAFQECIGSWSHRGTQ